MRLAIVHERFTELGGSERVVEQLHELWPDAPIYAGVVDRSVLPAGLRDAEIRPSDLQRRYHGGPDYARLLPLLPRAFARLDLSGFDAVITSHHAFANRVRPPAGVPVLSYTYTPARWIWDATFRRGERFGALGSLVLGAFAATQRGPDRRAAARLHAVAADSTAVAGRIRDWWGRADARVVSPPVDIHGYTPDAAVEREDFFLVAGRLVPYKQPLTAIAAARAAGVRLVVGGDGRLREEAERAAGDGIEVRGPVSDEELRSLYRRCRALLFPGHEDFGIVPVEAQACGAPVIARATGGALDTVIDGVTGSLYPAAGEGAEELAEELRRFPRSEFDARVIREHAEGFSQEHFRTKFREFVASSLA